MYYRNKDDSNVIIIVWVDDIIIGASDESLLNSVKFSLGQRFKMKDMGELSWFLGIEFKRENGCIEMNQTKYLEKILFRFKMNDCKPKATPCDLDVNKIRDKDSSELADPRLYREIVGSLTYVMTGTRPDLCYILTKLPQHMAKPTKAHLNMAKQALRYIKGTINQRLTFRKSDILLKISGYCDADWGVSEDRRSITGNGFQLSKDGPLVSWKS